MKVSTSKEASLMDLFISMDCERGFKLAQMLFRRIARRQERILKENSNNSLKTLCQNQ